VCKSEFSIEEATQRWKPDVFEEYHYINDHGQVESAKYDPALGFHQRRYHYGNCFRTEGQATKASEVQHNTFINSFFG
jgi:hypothetical protein